MLFLDSASEEDARAAVRLGYVAGVTTNPTLMAREGGDPLARLEALLGAFPGGPVLYQPATPERAREEAEAALALDPDRVVPKLPAQADLLGLARELADRGAAVAVTAVYHPAQAVAAAGAGAARLMGEEGERLVARAAAALLAVEARTGILAASIKDPEQAVQALLAGARAVTAPLGVLEAMAEHELSRRATEEFGRTAG